VGARGGAWARACACAYMRNARTFAASASSWSMRARRIAFSSSTATEHKEGSEDEEEGGEEGEEEGGEEDEEERGEEDELLWLPVVKPEPERLDTSRVLFNKIIIHVVNYLCTRTMRPWLRSPSILHPSSILQPSLPSSSCILHPAS